MNHQVYTKSYQKGFNLLEVLIGVVIFAVGMLALAQLQGGLTRSTADANVRSVASNIAEEIIEFEKGFGWLDIDITGEKLAYANITNDITDLQITNDGDTYNDPLDMMGSYTTTTTDGVVTLTFIRGGIAYSVTQTAVDYFYDHDAGDFTTTNNYSAYFSDLKLITLTVSWDDTREFAIDDTQTTTGGLGTGSITMSNFLSSAASQTNSLSLTQESNNQIAPIVPFTPGDNPDIVALDLGENRFKESSLPEPDVIRSDELVETRFDVITYAQSESNVFLRREEFISVSCTCELNVPPGSAASAGRRPTVWAADEYEEPEFAIKPYGTSTSNIQSAFCDTCCQDHHDGGTASSDQAGDPGRSLYSPWRAAADYFTDGSFNGDHKHYSYNNQGALVLADTDGDDYVESCRLVRKDGFFRVAQDMRREGLNVFAYDYLDHSDEIAVYSGYVTDAVLALEADMTDGYEDDDPQLVVLDEPAADLFPESTILPTFLGTDYQQLRSRGIYVDYMTEDLRFMVDCLQADQSKETCSHGSGHATWENPTIELDTLSSENVLTIIPFYDVQMTFLNRWVEDPPNDPVDTTNEALATENAHSRGKAELITVLGTSIVEASGDRSNRGLTDTDPIDNSSDITGNSIEVVTSDEVPDPPEGTSVITGDILSGVTGFRATNVDIAASQMACNRVSDGYVCFIAGSSPVLTVSGYTKPNTKLVACSATLTKTNASESSGAPTASFSLADADSNVSNDIVIQEDVCTISP